MPQKTYIINGKKYVADKPLTDEEIDEIAGSQEPTPEPERSPVQKGWDFLTQPLTDLPSRAARGITQSIPKMDEYMQSANQMIPGLGTGLSMVKGFGEGALEGAGDVLTGFTSPSNLALTAVGMGEAAAARQALSGLKGASQAAAAARTAQNLGTARKALSVVPAVHGSINLLHGGSTPMERLMGGIEAAGGAAGLKIPRFSGNARYSDPSSTMYSEGPIGPKRLSEGDFAVPPEQSPFIDADILSGQDVNPVPAPINRGRMFPPPEVMEGQVLPELDPRITSLAPETPAMPPMPYIDDIPPPSGMPGPLATGYQSPDLSAYAKAGVDSPLPMEAIGDPADIRAGIEAARARARQQVDDEFGMAPIEPEVLPAEPELDMFGYPKDRDLTPQEVEDIKRSFLANERQYYGPDTAEYDRMVDDANGIIDIEPQEMRVPGPKGTSGLSNVAMGGASERVLDVLGSSLYSGERPTVATKELLQNAFDEHRISGQTAPIKVVFSQAAVIPDTGKMGRSVTVSDRGRGLKPAEIYTKLTNVGETGKAGIESASGGFGFAKAAPFLGGSYTKVHSVVQEGGKRVEYTFEGNPKELKNQKKGVPLSRKEVGEDTPTGLTVTSWYPGETYVYNAQEFAKNMTKLSGNITSDVKMYNTYGDATPDTIDWIRKDNPKNVIERAKSYELVSKGQLPPKQGEVTTPGAKVNIHFKPPEAGEEHSGYSQQVLNKGLFQASDYRGYGDNPIPNVPNTIVTDIIATVEEGASGYPFTANREQLDSAVRQAINNWISTNIVQGSIQSRIAALQRKYDAIAPLGNSKIGFLDEGSRLTPTEIQMINEHPFFQNAMNTVHEVFQELLLTVDGLNWAPEYPSGLKASKEGWYPSKRLQKFGLLFQAPDPKSGSTTLGIHIPSPGNLDQSAILLNVMEHIKQAMGTPNPVDQIAAGIHTTLTHEIAHIPGGGHDTGFAYRHAALLSELGRKQSNLLMEDIANAFGDINTGELNPELQDLLQIYDESRQRTASEDDALLRTGIHQQRPPNNPSGTTYNVRGSNQGGPRTGASRGIFSRLGDFIGEGNASKTREVYDLARGMTSVDLPFLTSAALRQGLPWVASRHWWKAWVQQAKAFSGKRAYERQRDILERDPLFAPRMEFQGNRATPTKSWAEQAGLELTDLTDLTKREEVLRSTLAERLPYYGKYVQASNRAYTSFLNHIRANTFKDLATSMGIWDGRRFTDMPAAKILADFINTTTGRGKLEVGVGISEKYSKTLNVEKAAEHLSDIFFSPRLQTSRVKMLNPSTYLMAPKEFRMMWVKVLLSAIGAWWTITSMLEMAGAKVSKDPNSSDFGKARIGNSRIDPGGGFQQYLVINHRILPQLGIPTNIPGVEPTNFGPPFTAVDLATGMAGTPGGGITSPVSRQFHPYGQGYRPETAGSDLMRFVGNKLHPVPRLGYDMLFRSERYPVFLGDRLMQMFLPMYTSDVAEVLQDNPALLPGILVGSSVGMGTQTFEGGPGKPSITPLLGTEEFDIKLR